LGRLADRLGFDHPETEEAAPASAS
jgi:hypothetical protein